MENNSNAILKLLKSIYDFYISSGAKLERFLNYKFYSPLIPALMLFIVTLSAIWILALFIRKFFGLFKKKGVLDKFDLIDAEVVSIRNMSKEVKDGEIVYKDIAEIEYKYEGEIHKFEEESLGFQLHERISVYVDPTGEYPVMTKRKADLDKNFKK